MRTKPMAVSKTTHLHGVASLDATREPVWYSSPVGSGRLDAVSNLVLALPI